MWVQLALALNTQDVHTNAKDALVVAKSPSWERCVNVFCLLSSVVWNGHLSLTISQMWEVLEEQIKGEI